MGERGGQWTDDQHQRMRRVVARTVRRFVHDPDLIEELSQATLARLLAAAPALSGGELEAYATVAARNAVRTYRRDERARADKHARLAARANIEHAASDSTMDPFEQHAIASAFGLLGEDDRHLLTEIDVEGHSTRHVAQQRTIGESTIRMRLLRARARLRVRYLLAVNGRSAPGPCLAVLDAISARDRARAGRLDAADHLARCELCASLAADLEQRHRPWPMVLVAGPFATVWRWVRERPVVSAGAGAAGLAAITAAAVVIPTRPDGPPATETVSPVAPLRLAASGAPLTPPPAAIAASVGASVDATDVLVVEVVGDEALWIGDAGAPLLLLLSGGESPPVITSGRRLSFAGAVLVRSTSDQIARFGADPPTAARLPGLGIHLELLATEVQVTG